MKIITFSTFVGSCNRGAEALLRTRIESIRKLVPDTKFYVLSVYTETCRSIKDVEYIDTFGARREKLRSIKYIILSACKGISWTFNAMIFRLSGFCFNSNIKKIASSKIFVSADGDILGEDYGIFPFLWRIYFLSLGIILKKPIIIYGEGAGPFRSKFGKFISTLFFKRCAYISVREKVSLKHLVNLGIDRKKIHLVADSAFLLRPSTKEFNYRKRKKRLIGISVSRLVSTYGFSCRNEEGKNTSLFEFTAKLIDWMIENLNANIIMIPHVIQVGRDDYQTARDILKKVKNKKQVTILSKDLDATEFKKAISHCDLVIASRMHASIAALSTYIPAISIAYSHKTKGIYDSLGVTGLIIDIKDLDWRITDKIQEVLANSSKIKSQLKKKIVSTKKLAEKPSFEVARLLEQEDNNFQSTKKSKRKND